MDELGHVREFGQRLLDVGGAAAAEIAPERIGDVIARAAVDEGAGDMRPSQRAAVAPPAPAARAARAAPLAPEQLRLHILELDRHPEALQLGDDLLAPAAARGARLAQERL